MNFNLNHFIKVKPTEKGFEHMVASHNGYLPLRYHISFNEAKAKADADGYVRMQLHEFANTFGGLGVSLADYVETNIILCVEDSQL